MADTMEAQLEVLSQENALMKKYLALRNKCEQLQQGNEKLVNRIHHVKKLVKRYKRDRRFLQSRLDSYNDNYREAQVPVMWEEDQMYSLLKPPAQASPSKEALPTLPTELIASAAPPTKAAAKPCKKIKSLLKSQQQQEQTQTQSAADIGNTAANQSSLDRLAQLKSLFAGQTIKQEPGLELLTNLKQEPVDVGEASGQSAGTGSGTVSSGKSPAMAFRIFCDQHKQAVQNQYIQEKNELITSQELTKRLAVKWQTLPNEDKKIYFDLAERSKSRMPDLGLVKQEVPDPALEAMQMESDAAVSSLLNT